MKGHLSCLCWATGDPNAVEKLDPAYYVAPRASNLAFEGWQSASKHSRTRSQGAHVDWNKDVSLRI